MRRSLSRNKILLGVAATVAVGAFAGWLVWRSSVHRGGPLDQPGWAGTAVPIVTGDIAVAGDYQVLNYGHQAVVLEAARPLGLPAGLELLRTYALGKQRPRQSGGGMHWWPDDEIYPRKLLQPVRGFHAPPDRKGELIGGTNIVFLVRAKRSGTYGFDFVELRYRVGNKRYRRIITNSWAACARPKGTPEKMCDAPLDPPSDKQLDQWYDRTSGDW
ncbi:MAG: hypothetical protein QM679_02335 [Patulibacter sp.]